MNHGKNRRIDRGRIDQRLIALNVDVDVGIGRISVGHHVFPGHPPLIPVTGERAIRPVDRRDVKVDRHYIHETRDSELLRQRERLGRERFLEQFVARIEIAVPHFSRRQQLNYIIPKYLEELPRVRLLHCETDWGPATKFIAVVREELATGRDDSLIMIVDDDRVYPADALETYLFYHQQLPQAALCFRGAPMPSDLKWRKPKITRGDRIREPRRVAVVTGCGSYFIQPRFFDEQLWDYSNAPDGAFYMDDIWISGCLDRRGVAKYLVPASGMMRTVRQQSGTMTLHDVPNGRRHNNNEAIAFFSDSWNVFSPR